MTETISVYYSQKLLFFANSFLIYKCENSIFKYQMSYSRSCSDQRPAAAPGHILREDRSGRSADSIPPDIPRSAGAKAEGTSPEARHLEPGACRRGQCQGRCSHCCCCRENAPVSYFSSTSSFYPTLSVGIGLPSKLPKFYFLIEKTWQHKISFFFGENHWISRKHSIFS